MAIVSYKVVFVPVNIEIETSPSVILADAASPVVVTARLVNKLGTTVPFRRVVGKFVVTEGDDLIAVLSTTPNRITFKTGGKTGKLVILYYSRSVPFPVETVLDIKGAALARLSPQ